MSSNIKVTRICEYCDKEFTARTTITRFCSHACNGKAYKETIRKSKIELSNAKTRKVILQPFEVLKVKPFLSITESCELLGISRRTMYRLLERGEIKAAKIGKRTIIKRTEIDRLF